MSSCQLSCSAILGRSTAGTLGHPYPLTPAPSAAPVSELLLEDRKIHVQNILRTLTHQEEKSGHPLFQGKAPEQAPHKRGFPNRQST